MASPDPHVGLPSEEDVLRAINAGWRNGDEFDNRAALSAILALIRPAFEAKERELAAVTKVKHYLAVSEVEDPFAAMIDECEAMEARALSAEAKLALAVEALEPFAKAAGVVEWTSKATGRQFPDDVPFRSGLAWREKDGSTGTLTYGAPAPHPPGERSR
jgi:hypothetical protein